MVRHSNRVENFNPRRRRVALLRARAWCFLSCLLCVLLTGVGPAAFAQEVPRSREATLPEAAQTMISASLGRHDGAYHAVARVQGLRAENPRHLLTAEFHADRVEVMTGAVRWRMALRGYGYGDALQPLARLSPPRAAANRVEYAHGSLTEWYVNGPLGLEQGFTLETAPPRRAPGPLALEIALSGDLEASIDSTRQALTLKPRGGPEVLRYSGLVAYDRRNQRLPAWLALETDRLVVRVDDAGAQYPVVVDPWIQQAKLTASDGVAADSFGFSIAVSGDTVVVGAPAGPGAASTDQGAAYVFVKPMDGWASMTETVKLTASDGAAGDQFGSAVAISANTVVVGAAGDNNFQGAAYVFVKPPTGWTSTSLYDGKLVASDGAELDSFGSSVGISSDAETVVVGAAHQPYPEQFGAAYVFVRPGSGWTDVVETAKLTASDAGEIASLGSSVAVSDDTVVVGAEGADVASNIQQGAVYVFVKPAGGWIDMTQTAKLTASTGAAGDHLGVSVAAGGQTVVAGAFGANDQGAAYVFERPAGGWVDATETATLTASDGTGHDENFGAAVAISGDTVVVGAYQADYPAPEGAVYVFVKPAGGWMDMTETAKLAASDGALFDDFGWSVAVSDGTVVGGARSADSDRGVAYVFVPGASATAAPGEQVTVSTAPTTAGEAGVTATLNNNTDGSGPATITVQPLDSAPAGAPTLIDVGGRFVDLRVEGADASDSVDAFFYYPSSIMGAMEAELVLLYLDPALGWIPVQSGGSPLKDTTDNLDGTVSGGRFTVTFDDTSAPAVTELTGTVFSAALTAAGGVNVLIDAVDGLNLQRGLRQSLLAPLKAAAGALDRGHPGVARLLLSVFVREVEILRRRGLLPSDQADGLSGLAQSVIDSLS
jgi:hypothetical protein